jgi:predicted O-methyltransferase YrrM
MVVRKRNELAALLKSMKLLGTGVEVGVAEGGFSFYFLDNWPGTLYQVDMWSAIDPSVYKDYCNVGMEEQERRYKLVLDTARKYGGRAIPMRSTSKNAAALFQDKSLDFVYIDANHALEFVREDLKLWWPKLKSGAVFAGHDYLDGTIASGEYGVKTAVTEFATAHNLQVNVTLETDYPSWWLVKP